MPLYHCSHLLLSAGGFIEPGNWGKTIFNTGVGHPAWRREIALEAVRSWNFPKKPSRLKSAFACNNLAAMKFYKDHQCQDGHIYEVEVVDMNCEIHQGDFNAVEPLPIYDLNMWQIAELYWMYQLRPPIKDWPGLECTELVIPSALKIIHVI